jgi:hypothetical protein
VGEEASQPVESSPLRDADRNRIFNDLDERMASRSPSDHLPIVAVFNRILDIEGYNDDGNAKPEFNEVFDVLFSAQSSNRTVKVPPTGNRKQRRRPMLGEVFA